MAKSIEDIEESALSSYFEEFNKKITQCSRVPNDEIKELINRHTELLEKADDRGYRALHLAVENNNSDIVTFLIDKKKVSPNQLVSPPNQPFLRECYTPLHVAAKNGCYEVVQSLIKAKANLNATFSGDKTALHLAAENNHVGVVRLLLEKDARITTMSPTALEYAAKNGHLSAAELLVEFSLKEYTPEMCYDITKVIQHALDEAAIGGHVAVVDFLLNKEICDEAAIQKALRHAVKGGHVEVVKSLNGRIELVKFLLSKNPDLNICDKDGKTALDLIAEKNLELIKILPKLACKNEDITVIGNTSTSMNVDE